MRPSRNSSRAANDGTEQRAFAGSVPGRKYYSMSGKRFWLPSRMPCKREPQTSRAAFANRRTSAS